MILWYPFPSKDNNLSCSYYLAEFKDFQLENQCQVPQQQLFSLNC